MNGKRFIAGTIAVFVFIFIYEWIFHGPILGHIYQSTPDLWRPHTDMEQYFVWLVLGQLLFAVMFCIIFLPGYKNRGLMEGARYGFLIGLFFISTNLIFYAVQPLPSELVIYWSVGGLIETIIAGMLLAGIYRPASG